MLNVNVVIFTTHMKTLRVTLEHVTHHLHKNSHIAYVLPHPHDKALRATYHLHQDDGDRPPASDEVSVLTTHTSAQAISPFPPHPPLWEWAHVPGRDVKQPQKRPKF